jgi:hypothetical protein
MEITIRIDNSDARIFVADFANHTAGIRRTTSSRSTAMPWSLTSPRGMGPCAFRRDLERKRAEEIYNELKQQAIDLDAADG